MITPFRKAAPMLFALSLSIPISGQALITTFQNDLAGFNAAGGNPGVGVSFDDLVAGQDLNGLTLNGVTFSNLGSGNTLDVVLADSTFTSAVGYSGVPNPASNTLPATTGIQVLSPGGVELVPGPNVAEMDSIQLSFANPISVFGLDVLFQSFDFAPLVSFQLLNGGTSISSGSVAGTGGGGGGSPAEARFLGFVSDAAATDFDTIILRDGDGNNVFPDNNLGYDSLRFHSNVQPPPPPPAGVPEPQTLGLMLGGLGLLTLIRRRRQG